MDPSIPCSDSRPCVRCARPIPLWESASQCLSCFVATARDASRRDGQERTLRRMAEEADGDLRRPA